jgi:hydrogenase maturation protein HypF
MHASGGGEGSDRVRFGVRIRGTVQGVGFRPAVYRVAQGLALGGLVRNDDEGVWIEVEGARHRVARFGDALVGSAPPLSRIDAVEVHALVPVGEDAFRIVPSQPIADVRARIPADVGPCDECRAELADPQNRRYRYPFINCIACGPRYTIVRDLPYDRDRTTMRGFAQCEACRREYEDPRSRRFHAEPNACPVCGPQLAFHAPRQAEIVGEPALAAAVAMVQAGRIVAVRGVGGFLLAVDARNQAAVERLRARKHRPHKPFALMARDLGTIERIAHLDESARRALVSASRPIVLLRARGGSEVAPAVAPGLAEVGVMLPSTPLHELLLGDGPSLQVMTSGNRADEPIARDDDDAAVQLGEIADGFLTHDRPIHTRVDDSVVRVVAGEVRPIRRARGFVPEPITLPVSAEPVLAVGGELKNTVCVTRGNEAFVSQHLGDLSHPAALVLLGETVEKLGHLVDVRPTCVAHDLHPDYHATRWALGCGLPTVAVQHHHAHVAACLVEHGRRGPALGVALDGTGCGPAGELWGGEWLLFDLHRYRRLGHLRPLPLPGGEAAIRQPWRLGAAALLDAGIDLSLLERIAPRERELVRRLIASAVAAPRATGAGRWFDAVAALCAVRDEVSYEGQAAIELEALAGDESAEPYPFAVVPWEPFEIDLRLTIVAIAGQLASGVPTAHIAAAFHETLAQAVARGCVRVRQACATEVVALSGGCFQNARLSRRCAALLEAAGFEVLQHRRVPANDGGLSLGQAAIAACRRSNVGDVGDVGDDGGGVNVSRHSR